MNYINNIDRKFFYIINNDWSHGILDQPMVFLSSRLTWICFFAVCFAVACYLRRWRIVWLCGFLGVTILVADLGVFYGLKPFFGRLRPCKEFPEMVRAIQGCAGKLGLPSNHAANAMAVVAMLFLMKMPVFGSVAFLLALLVGYSRIYLGMHYPSDILVGYLAGTLAAVVVFVATKPIHALVR